MASRRGQFFSISAIWIPYQRHSKCYVSRTYNQYRQTNTIVSICEIRKVQCAFPWKSPSRNFFGEFQDLDPKRTSVIRGDEVPVALKAACQLLQIDLSTWLSLKVCESAKT